MVYDPTIKEQEKDIEMWHKSFVGPLSLPDSQVLCDAHDNCDPLKCARC